MNFYSYMRITLNRVRFIQRFIYKIKYFALQERGIRMFYIILFFIIFFVMFSNVVTNKNSNLIFKTIFLILITLSIFRFGSGTDYFGYWHHYYRLPDDTLVHALNYNNGMEIGFNFLMFVFKEIGANYQLFIGSVSLFTMIIFYKVIKSNSQFEMGSLLILAANYYPIYVNSAIRQGIALALVMLATFAYLQNKKILKYVIIVFIASLFHISAIVTLLFIPIIILSRTKLNNTLINILLIFLSIILYLMNFSSIISVVFPEFHYVPSESNLLTIVLRIFFLILIFLLSKNAKYVTPFEESLIYIYFMGTLLFFSTSNITILSRLLEYFIISEVIIIPNLIVRQKESGKKMLFSLSIAIVFGTLLIKDLNSFTFQQDYYNTGASQYRYTSIFNKNKIDKYRDVNDFGISY